MPASRGWFYHMLREYMQKGREKTRTFAGSPWE